MHAYTYMLQQISSLVYVLIEYQDLIIAILYKANKQKMSHILVSFYQ